ncbi:hypothetical protein J6590_101204 [Homalodisca vitripennis]|nr:hypothetical protein J6590_096107 [Homalodisca vitripennis]KAG8314062.1 hypothetical protein J6590_101204 [Homalodisca vitripennis]
MADCQIENVTSSALAFNKIESFASHVLDDFLAIRSIRDQRVDGETSTEDVYGCLFF